MRLTRQTVRAAVELMAVLLCAASTSGDSPARASAALGPRPPGAAAAPPVSLDEVDFAQAVDEPEGLVHWLDDGRRVVFSVDPAAQAAAEALLDSYAFPRAAVVLLDVRTGRVIVFASRDGGEGGRGALCLDASAPAASVFKIVTAAALIEAGAAQADTSVCYHGGTHAIVASHLIENPSLDRACATLGDAMGRSINVPFARLAARHLRQPDLRRMASLFGFGAPPTFDLPAVASPFQIPDDRLELGRTAAGFGAVHLSPLHGALIAATIAGAGQARRPWLVDSVLDTDGRAVYRAQSSLLPRVLSERTAQALGAMLRRTTTEGTARSAFFDAAGNPFLPGVAVAGKTGTLNDRSLPLEYTWFVGYAPAGDPQYAVSALVANGPRWRVRASFVAREILRQRFAAGRAARPGQMPAASTRPDARVASGR